MNFELYNAVENNNVKGAEELLKNGADPEYSDFGRTMLTLAACDGNVEMCKLLVKHGANVDKKDDYNDYPIHWAVSKNNMDLLSFLMEAGAGVNVKNRDSDTPLHCAIQKSYDHIFERLLASDKSDLEIKDKQGKTLLELLKLQAPNKETILSKIYEIKNAQVGKFKLAYNKGKTELNTIAKEIKALKMDKVVKEITEKQCEIEKLDVEINDLNTRLTKLQTQRSQFEEERISLEKEQEDLQKDEENEVESFSWVKKDYECSVYLIIPYAPKQIVQCTNGFF